MQERGRGEEGEGKEEDVYPVMCAFRERDVVVWERDG
jgi:hypothetical protein